MIAYDESNIVSPDMYHLPKKGAVLWVSGEDYLYTVDKVQFLSGQGLQVVCTRGEFAWPPIGVKIRCKKEDLLPVTEETDDFKLIGDVLPVTEETDDFKLYDLVVLKPKVLELPAYENFNGVLMIGRLDTPNVYVHHTREGYQDWIPRADLLKVVLPDYS